MGYVIDSNSSRLRPITGIPGAAVISAPVLTDLAFSRFVTARDQAWGIGLTQDGSQVVTVDLAENRSVAIPAAPAPASLVGLSPNGRFAVVAGAGRMVVIGGLPSQPAITREVDLTGISDALQSVAIADEGQRLLFATSAGLYGATGDQSPQLLVSGSGIRAVRILSGNAGAVYLNVESGSVYQLGAGSDPVQLRNDLAGALDLADAGPAGVAIAVEGGLALLSLDTREVRRVECDCTVTLLDPLMSNSAFRLTGFDGNAARVVDLTRGEPRVVLLPPPAQPEEPAGGAQ